jgi:hypothetical protein
LRSRVARVGVCADRPNAEGSESVIDDGGNRFTPISLSPIRLAQPVAERGFVGFGACVTIKADTADDAVVFLQCDGEASRTTGCVVLLHHLDPLSPIRFAVGMRHGRDPPRDLPITNQRDQVGKIVVPQQPEAEPRGFDDNAGRFIVCH